ncbi:hypothetical protein GCM10020000_68070 [Streptomyces olivoverticillatus]
MADSHPRTSTSQVLLDIAERTLAAYITTFLGLLIADGFDLTSVSAIKAAAIAALLGRPLRDQGGAIGARFGDRTSAAWLPRRSGGVRAGGRTEVVHRRRGRDGRRSGGVHTGCARRTHTSPTHTFPAGGMRS